MPDRRRQLSCSPVRSVYPANYQGGGGEDMTMAAWHKGAFPPPAPPRGAPKGRHAASKGRHAAKIFIEPPNTSCQQPFSTVPSCPYTAFATAFSDPRSL